MCICVRICVLAIHMGTVTDFGVCVWACVCGCVCVHVCVVAYTA